MKAALILLISVAAFADVVTLKDGRQLTGEIASGTASEIRIKVDNVEQSIAVDRIMSIQFGASSAVPAAPAAIPSTITLPAGTEIAVRTIDGIDSKTADEYREYAASLDSPVVVNNVTVLPAQTRAFFRATDIVKPGFRRPASISLSLIGVMVAGQRIAVETSKLESQGAPQGKHTGKGALIGGATGAVFGALFAGGRGSLIGAAVGAAGGAFVSKLLQRGVEIPPETRFTYKLTKDAVMNPKAPAPSVATAQEEE